MEFSSPKNYNTDALNEFQRVFSVISSNKITDPQQSQTLDYLNQHNVFTINNVTAFVQRMVKNYVLTTKNCGQIMPLLDSSNSGLISWDAFAIAMEELMQRYGFFEGIYKKKSSVVIGYHERKILHSFIANYFMLNTQDIGDDLNKLNNLLGATGTLHDFQLIEMDPIKDLDKNTIIKDTIELLDNFQAITKDLSSALTIMAGLQSLNRLYRVISYASNSLEIYVNSRIINRILDLITNSGKFETIMEAFINDETELELKYEAIKCITLMTFSMTLQTPFLDGSYYLKRQEVQSNLLHEDFLELLINASCCEWIEIRYQALLCLSFLLQLDDNCKANLVNSSLIEKLIPNINPDKKDLAHIEAIGALLSTLAAHISVSFNSPLEKNFLVQLMEAGYQLITTTDHYGILKSGFSIIGSIAHLLPVSDEIKIIFNRMVNLLAQHESLMVKKFALIAIKDVIENSEQKAEVMYEQKLLQLLEQILINNYETLKLGTLRIISLMSKTHPMVLIESKILGQVYKAIDSTPECKNEAIKILDTLLSHSSATVTCLVDKQIVGALFKTMRTFKEDDETLLESYSFQGKYTNLLLVIDCISMLNHIINKGYSLKSSTIKTSNYFVEFFDKECLEDLVFVVKLLFEDQNELKAQINRSYVKYYGENPFEKMFGDFLTAFRGLHKGKDTEVSKHITLELNQTITYVAKQFEQMEIIKNAGELTGETKMECRLLHKENFPNGDNRFFEMDSKCSYEKLYGQVEQKYNYYGHFLMKFLPENDVMFTIDGDQSWKKAIDISIKEFVTMKKDTKIPIVSVMVEFIEDFEDNQNEIQCFECGRVFEVLELHEPFNKDEPFICDRCRAQNNNSPQFGSPAFSSGYGSGPHYSPGGKSMYHY